MNLRSSGSSNDDAGAHEAIGVPTGIAVLDGVYRSGANGVPVFVEVDSPTDDEVHALLQTLITLLMKLLTRRGVLVEEMGQTCLAEPDAEGNEARVRCHDRATSGRAAGQLAAPCTSQVLVPALEGGAHKTVRP